MKNKELSTQITVVTVCLNAEKDIEKTICSVLKQKINSFEYIIKDGGSNDDTVKIAKKYQDLFTQKGIVYNIVSQKDNGIYDAMNQAAQAAQGKWIIYMNAGDQFSNDDVILQVNDMLKINNPDILYGDTILSDSNMYLYKRALPLTEITSQMIFCHQSTFTKKELLISQPYSINYKICSDYEFYLSMYIKEKTFLHMSSSISIYDVNGISSNDLSRNYEMISILTELVPKSINAIEKRQKESIVLQNNSHSFRKKISRLLPDRFHKKRKIFAMKKMGWSESIIDAERRAADTPADV